MEGRIETPLELARVRIDFLAMLPDEMCLHILCYLQLYDIKQHFGISQRFYSLFHDKTLWHSRLRIEFPQHEKKLKREGCVDWRAAYYIACDQAYKTITNDMKTLFRRVRYRKQINLVDNRVIVPSMLVIEDDLEKKSIVRIAYETEQQDSLDMFYKILELILQDSFSEFNKVDSHCFYTRLVWAVHLNQPEVEIDRLLAIGFNINGQEFNGLSYSPLGIAAKEGRLDQVQMLLDKGAAVNRGLSRATPLALAVMGGHLDVCELLLRYHADPNINVVNLGSPLTIAAAKNHDEIFKLLIEQHADVNYFDVHLNTAAILVTQRGRLDLLQRLVEAGARLTRENASYPTVLGTALNHGYLDIADYVLSLGILIDQIHIQKPPLYWAIYAKNYQLFIEIIKRDAQVQEYAEIYLITSAKSLTTDEDDAWKIFCYLLDNLNLNIHYITESEKTLLHLAACNANGAVIKKLITRGLKVNAVDRDLMSPLHHAIENGNLDAIKVLGEAGADTNCRTIMGVTPLMLAVRSSSDKAVTMVSYLLAHCADPNIADNKQETPLLRAVMKKNLTVVKLLIQYHVNPFAPLKRTMEAMLAYFTTYHSFFLDKNAHIKNRYYELIDGKGDELVFTAETIAMILDDDVILGELQRYQAEIIKYKQMHSKKSIEIDFENSAHAVIPQASKRRFKF